MVLLDVMILNNQEEEFSGKLQTLIEELLLQFMQMRTTFSVEVKMVLLEYGQELQGSY